MLYEITGVKSGTIAVCLFGCQPHQLVHNGNVKLVVQLVHRFGKDKRMMFAYFHSEGKMLNIYASGILICSLEVLCDV